MKKSHAISIFGSTKELVEALGMTRQAVHLWSDVLTQKQADQVVGAAVRLNAEYKRKSKALQDRLKVKYKEDLK